MEGKEEAGDGGPVTKPPASDDPPIQVPEANQEPTENDTWWGSWTSSTWAKTITDVSSNITKSVSHGIELANQALDKEIEIEIDVDKVVNATKNIATKTIEHSKTIIEKSGDVVDQSMKMVDEGVKTVSKDVAELSEAIVEDSKATYSAFSEATYSTIEQVGGSETAKTASAVKDSVFGAVNALASVILADSSDEEDNSTSRGKTLSGPEARLHQLRVSPATYCNEAEDMIDYLEWLEKFNIENDATKADISEVMVECPEVRALYSKLVPTAVTHSDFWHRYFYRLHLHQSAELRRSRLVERANTDDDDDDLDSWGDDDSASEDEKDDEKTVESAPPAAEPPASENPENPQPGEEEEKVETEKISEKIAKISKKNNSKSGELAKDQKNDEPVERQSTPQSNESRNDSEWTAVDKSESDDWEREFDLEMTEEEIQEALQKEEQHDDDTTATDETVKSKPGEKENDWDDWS